MTTVLIPVDVYPDDKGLWHWSIDNPAAVGGGQSTKQEALEAAAEALAFSLESDKEPVADPDEPDGVIELLEVTIRPTT